jgi:hypothetical protein
MTDKPTGGDDARTEELPVVPSPSESPARGRSGGLVPGVAGVVLCVLWIMGIGMVVAQLVSAQQDRPGPGALAVGAHVAAAVLGVVSYRAVSRNPGLPRLLGLIVLLAMTVALLWFFWWSPAR